MEQPLPLLASTSKSTTTPFSLELDQRATTASSTAAEVPTPAAAAASDPSRQSNNNEGDSEIIKVNIMSHPLYPALLRAFIDCRKVGAPPEVVGRLSALAGEVDMNSNDRQEELAKDPELDQFMEMYCHMLERYKQELTRPIQEADEFFRTMEAQIDLFVLDDKGCELGGRGSSDEDEQEITGGDDVDGLLSSETSGEDKELKTRLLDKYSGYLSSLWRELSRKKKKKGKLPRDARQKLLHWWQLHYRWPYPSEPEKAALAESTGLDAKQINNWFINQRKRHWKPAPPPAMLAPAADYRGASSSSANRAALRAAEGHYFPGGSTYPREP